MTKDEALKMAYDWLNEYAPDEVVQACKEALEQPTLTYEDGFAHGYEAHRAEQALEQPAQEPVAWIKYVWKPYEEEDPDDDGFYPDIDLDTYDNGGDPLYTHPAPSWQGNKEFVGLSDDERFIIVQNADWDNPYDIAELIEQALKEKNNV